MTASTAAFDAVLRRGLEEELFAGAVLRVEGRGKMLFEGAWGDALRVEGERKPMVPSTLFDLASLSKLFTTTAVLRLASQGALALVDPVIDFYRRVPEDGELLARLAGGLGGATVESLLAHSSGIHYWYPFYTRRGERFERILADVLEAHPRRPEVIYSDLNFMLLGRLVEIATGRRLAEALRSLVFEPLGLDRASYGRPIGTVAATEFGNRIERGMVADLGLHFDGWRDESRPILGEADDGNCFYFFGGAAGHAGVFCDARNLCRLGELYRDGGRVGGAAYLAPGLAEAAMRDRGGGRGLGFQLGENYPGGGGGHTGFTGTYLYVHAATGIVIAILTNRLHVPRPRDINPFRRELAREVLAVFG